MIPMNNSFEVIGNVVRNPELRHTNGGTPVTTMTVATNNRFKGKDGTVQEKADFHEVSFFGKQAELATQYATKGRLVQVKGRLNYDMRKAVDKNGKPFDLKVVQLVGGAFQLLGRKPDSAQGASTAGDEFDREPTGAAPEAGADLDDDIPF